MQRIPSPNLPINRKERINQPAHEVELRTPEERVQDFDEVNVPWDEERAMAEAARCLHCPEPAICTLACPVNNDIPSIMWLVEQGKFLEAAKIYREISSLPEVCGRVCPHTDLCAGACVLGKDGVPVRTGEIEAFVVDYARRMEGVEIPVGEPTGKNVAVVGGGPAGLSCAEQLVQNMEENGSSIISEIEDTADLLDDTSSAPIIKLVNHIISQSIKARASDIHIEPYQDSFKVRYRVDGILYDLLTPPKWIQAPLISRIKVMAEMNIAEKRLPQDGRLDVKMGDQEIDVRVSTIPISFGERVVLRLLNKTTKLFTLSNLGNSV